MQKAALAAIVFVTGLLAGAQAWAAEKRFNIIWHVGPQMEELADLSAENAKEVQEIERLVDGYYFLFVRGSHLRYWPQRPRVCELNFNALARRDIDVAIDGQQINSKSYLDVRRKCMEDFRKYETAGAPAGQDFVARNAAAQDRAVKALMGSGGRAGKPVIAEVLLAAPFFERGTDSVIRVKELPPALEVLYRNRVPVTDVMAYQEPSMQAKSASLVNDCSTKRCNATLQADAAIWVQDALRKHLASKGTASPVPNVLVNVRRWSAEDQTRFSDAVDRGVTKGVVMEGSAAMGPAQARRGAGGAVASENIKGAAWLLTHTAKRVYFLIPNHLPPKDLGRAQINDLAAYVGRINEGLREEMRLAPPANPVCNDRVYFIPAGYGAPVHLRQFAASSAVANNKEGGLTDLLRDFHAFRAKTCG